MNDLILNIVRFNEQVDFNIIIPFVILYVLAFWVIVSIWVFLDSKLRYGSRKKALLLAILNQIFGLPFLLLYILARPFIPEEQSGDHLSAVENGGVNVPIVNFMGKDGVVMSLQLSINSPTLVSNTQNPEMTIDVSFNSTDADKVLVEKTQKPKQLEFKESKAARFAGKIRSLFRKKESTLQLEKEIPETTVSDMEIKISESNKAKKKKNKKKRK